MNEINSFDQKLDRIAPAVARGQTISSTPKKLAMLLFIRVIVVTFICIACGMATCNTNHLGLPPFLTCFNATCFNAIFGLLAESMKMSGVLVAVSAMRQTQGRARQLAKTLLSTKIVGKTKFEKGFSSLHTDKVRCAISLRPNRSYPNLYRLRLDLCFLGFQHLFHAWTLSDLMLFHIRNLKWMHYFMLSCPYDVVLLYVLHST